MTTISLRPRLATPPRLAALERRNLIRLLRPTRGTLATRTATGAVNRLYTAAPRYGSHMLLCVGKRTLHIRLTAHPDHEDFILLKPAGRAYKPLYLIVALAPRHVLERRARAGTLRAADFAALELMFNDPATCFFTLRAGTVHCEVTRPGPGQHPVFFVSEPSRLPGERIVLPGHTLRIEV
jgi:hypothetical protein